MSSDLDSLPLDLADPATIDDQLPRIEEIVATKQHAAADAQRDFESWRALLDKLRFLTGRVLRIEEPRPPKFVVPPDVLDAVVGVVEREERPIMPLGVENALIDEGHEVESRDAVSTILFVASGADRLQQVGEDAFAPNSLDPDLLDAWLTQPAMRGIPEAHFGLDGPRPQTKSEAAVRVLASDPARTWTTPEVGQAMIGLGWMTDSDSDFASLASTLSRLHSQQKIFRPKRGRYRLAPPADEQGND